MTTTAPRLPDKLAEQLADDDSALYPASSSDIRPPGSRAQWFALSRVDSIAFRPSGTAVIDLVREAMVAPANDLNAEDESERLIDGLQLTRVETSR